jgi:hypothetical protein
MEESELRVWGVVKIVSTFGNWFDEEFEFMNLGFGIRQAGVVWGSMAIATLMPATSAQANSKTETFQVAQSGLCRAAALDTPIFEAASTTSRALRILPRDTQVTLVAIPPGSVPFAEITSPSRGFIQTAVLKLCSTPPDDKPWNQVPITGTACRRLVRPAVGVNVRRDPRTQGEFVTTIFPSRFVVIYLTTGGVAKSWRADNLDWVEIDLPLSLGPSFSGTGWIYNRDLLNNPQASNLVFCE